MFYPENPYFPDPTLPEDLAERPVRSEREFISADGWAAHPILLPPHCDEGVVHAPGECRYCDDRPDLQIQRLKNKNGVYRAPCSQWREALSK